MNAEADLPQNDQLLSVPDGVGRFIVESAAMFARPLLSLYEFCEFCRKRNLGIERERLLRFERLGLFRPIFRIRAEGDNVLIVPVVKGNSVFDSGVVWDTTLAAEGAAPNDCSIQSYYSVFQVDELRLLLAEFTVSLDSESFLELPDAADAARQRAEHWVEYAREAVKRRGGRDFRFSIALLCQAISNRYYPHTQTDQRTVRLIEGGGSWDRWMVVNREGWAWEEYSRSWDPRDIERRFALTPLRLKHAYEALASGQSFIDPLERWYPLVQFIALDERERLKGDALLAQTLREGAQMLRALYEDLYATKLPPVNEVNRTIVKHVPELEVRGDPRRYLEFVANRFGVNPQPTLVLLLEGASDIRAVERIFSDVFGIQPGACGIEIINLGGVSNATGGRQDFFQAIFRLIDYLHHHQTLTFLVLDNEGEAINLKRVAGQKVSIHGQNRGVTRPDYVRLWDQTFEFDNFSDAELALAMTRVSELQYSFTIDDLQSCRKDPKPGSQLNKLFKDKVGHELPKLALADALMDQLLVDGRMDTLAARPVVGLLEKVVELACKNPFPVMQEIWGRNQSSKLFRDGK